MSMQKERGFLAPVLKDIAANIPKTVTLKSVEYTGAELLVDGYVLTGESDLCHILFLAILA